MNRIVSIPKLIISGLEKAEDFIGRIGLIATTFLIFAQVINRYWLHFEIMWLNDLALYTFIFFMLFAAALTTCLEGHIAVDYFHSRALNEKPKGIAIHRIFIVFITITLTCFFIPVAYQFMLRAMKYPQYGTLVRWVNTSWLQESLFVAFTFILLHLLYIAGKDVSSLMKNWRSGFWR